MPLAESLRRERVTLLDGLAGDVLFGGSFVSQHMLDEPDRWRQWELMRSRLEQRRLQLKGKTQPTIVHVLHAGLGSAADAGR